MTGQTSARRLEGTKLYTLELGRILAASFVMLAHYIAEVNQHAAPGAARVFGGALPPAPIGVQYFFVLSGFVMASVHHGDFGKWRAVPKFWWRRACRIYPMYWLALLIPLGYVHFALPPAWSVGIVSLSPWWNTELIGPAWSLRYEIAFYIMFGLCLMPYLGRPLLAAWVVITIWRWTPFPLQLAAHMQFPGLITQFAAATSDHFTGFMEFYFFAGLAAGWAFMRFKPGPALCRAMLALGGAGWLAALPDMDWGGSYGSMPIAVLPIAAAFALFMLGLAGLERHGVLRLPPRAARVAGWAGTISYPLYILHAPLLTVFINVLPPFTLPSLKLYAMFLVGLPVIYGVSALAAFAFDQPVQRGLRRLVRRK